MAITETNAKSILRKHKKTDTWFVVRYGLNPYRGCTHNCAYCDGRAETYHVQGEFEKDIEVKVNAAEVLDKELSGLGKRKPAPRGFIAVGGGVCDSYQPVEQKYGVTRNILEILGKHQLPVSMITKNSLIERDIDLLKRINAQKKVIVNMSFSSTDDAISAQYEPGVSPPSRRLETLGRMKMEGFTTGMYLMPVIPFVTDTPEHINKALAKAKEVGVDYVLFSGMTLKEGRQKDTFLEQMSIYNPDKTSFVEQIYEHQDKWGSASVEYYSYLHEIYNSLAAKYKIPKRLPISIFWPHLDVNDRVAVALGQMHDILTSKGHQSPYGYASRQILALQEPISLMQNRLQQINGVGRTTERIIKEILSQGTSAYYEKIISE